MLLNISGSYKPGDIISHTEICIFEGFNVQQGMNFHTGHRGVSVLLMSTAGNAPYDDEAIDEGRIIIYEGHDIRSNLVEDSPKNHDQPLYLPSGRPTSNGKFFDAAKSEPRELARIYEKIKPGIWVYNGLFLLEDAWVQKAGVRSVVKFKLSIVPEQGNANGLPGGSKNIEQTRMIPSKVKFEVFRRDNGQCVQCGSKDNLHYDHDLPYSRGGTSLLAENIRLLCARHNLEKSNKIE